MAKRMRQSGIVIFVYSNCSEAKKIAKQYSKLHTDIKIEYLPAKVKGIATCGEVWIIYPRGKRGARQLAYDMAKKIAKRTKRCVEMMILTESLPKSDRICRW